jgi:uncharacterized Ntn-hydrolase superfamily protein
MSISLNTPLNGITKFMNRDRLSKKSAFLISIATFLVLRLAVYITNPHSSLGQSLQTNTWTIVAVDATTGDVGVAGASCVPDLHADGLAALAPGKGAAATQALFTMENRNRVFQLLKEGVSADEIIRQVSDPGADSRVADRQYGVVTMSNGSVTAKAFTGSNNLEWSGTQQDTGMSVTIQGNSLVSEAVVSSALQAFGSDSNLDHNTLPDRLMRALEAGSAAGGDSRCNNDQVEQTAATAFVLVARGIDEPYATRRIGITDMGTTDAPWLAISATESQFGPNPLIELRTLYNVWREENLASTKTSPVNPLTFAVVATIVFVLVLIARSWVKRKQSQNSS